MLVFVFAFLGTKAILASDLVTIGSAMRACIYAIPLTLLVVLTRPREHWLLKAAYLGFGTVAFAAILGGSRELGNALSLIPASLVAAYGVRLATREQQ